MSVLKYETEGDHRELAGFLGRLRNKVTAEQEKIQRAEQEKLAKP